MNAELRPTLATAIEDLKARTLSVIPGDLARLVYLSSTRDYNSGHYHHDGLAMRFSRELAEGALAACHWEVFRSLMLCTVEQIAGQLERYMRSTAVPVPALLDSWEKLEPYRVTIPLHCDPLAAELFFSNIRTALAILRARPEPAGDHLQSAWRSP